MHVKKSKNKENTWLQYHKDMKNVLATVVRPEASKELLPREGKHNGTPSMGSIQP